MSRRGGVLASARALFLALVPLCALAAFHPSSSSAALYAVTESGTLFESLSDGVSWTVKGNVPETQVVALSPGLTSGTLFALGRTGSLYASASAGATWGTLGSVGASDCVALALARGGDLVALTRSGDLHRSTDGGATWASESNLGASDCAAIAVGGSGGADDTLFAGTASGDIARTATGSLWATVGNTAFTPIVNLIWITGKLYALTDAGEFLLSSDAGATWTAIGAISQVGMRDVAFVGSGFKAISREGEVYESATGASWSSSWIGTTNQVTTVAVAPSIPEFQTGIGGPPTTPFVFEARPSIFTERVTFAITGAPAGVAPEIAIFDAAGRRLARMEPDAVGATVAWDGALPDGAPAASGVYFARVSAGPFTETIRIVLLR